MSLLLGTPTVWSKPAPVVFEASEIQGFDLDSGAVESLRQTILKEWTAYQNQDSSAYLAVQSPDLTRLSRRARHPQHGAAQVARELPGEWEAFERRSGGLAEHLNLRQARFLACGPDSVRASYWVEAQGGGRWDYDDQGLVLEALVRQQGQWKVVHHSESWSLSYDLDGQRAGRPGFDFDYVYPVQDVTRAVGFFQPLLGTPEWVNGQAASFNLGGPRFRLQEDPLQGLVRPHSGLPGGYAVFQVAHSQLQPDALQVVRRRLQAAGTRFLLGSENQDLQLGPDHALVCTDPSGNLLVVCQTHYQRSGPNPAPQLHGLEGQHPALKATRTLAAAWLSNDLGSLRKAIAPNGQWFDDRRCPWQGTQTGVEAILRALPEVYWNNYDRSWSGLCADLSASDVRVQPLGSGSIVSYRATLQGRGSHPFRETALVTHIFDHQQLLLDSFTVADSNAGGLARELDYTGYPVTDLRAAGEFYGRVLQLGKPYADEDYLGWWSNFAVFGIYRADPQQDGLPRSGQANGYVSFWVSSVQKALQYARGLGCSFPLIPAINQRSGISKEPGYQQLFTTDSEGNGVLFTEYTGLF